MLTTLDCPPDPGEQPGSQQGFVGGFLVVEGPLLFFSRKIQLPLDVFFSV